MFNVVLLLLTYQLAYEQQEIEFNQMADSSGTTQLDECTEITTKAHVARQDG